jgi:Leucine-rich repeat (LRR) protein
MSLRYKIIFLLVFGLSIVAKGQETTLDTSYVFRSLTEAAKDPSRVFKLSIRNTRLDSIPPVVFQMTNLRYLDLSRNRIDTISPEIGQLRQLTYLNLSNNLLKELPAAIGDLSELTYLGLSRNRLVRLPATIGDLSSLEVLELWDNELEDVPDEISRLQNLKLLELRGILFSEEQQARIDAIVVKSAKINMSPSCNCK